MASDAKVLVDGDVHEHVEPGSSRSTGIAPLPVLCDLVEQLDPDEGHASSHSPHPSLAYQPCSAHHCVALVV